MRWFSNQARCRVEHFKTDKKLDPLMPDENKNFRGSLFLDFRFEVALKNQH